MTNIQTKTHLLQSKMFLAMTVNGIFRKMIFKKEKEEFG